MPERSENWGPKGQKWGWGSWEGGSWPIPTNKGALGNAVSSLSYNLPVLSSIHTLHSDRYFPDSLKISEIRRSTNNWWIVMVVPRQNRHKAVHTGQPVNLSMAAFINSHRAQPGDHKVLYQPTQNVVYERSVALCAHSPTLISRVGLAGAKWALINVNNNGVGCEWRNCVCGQTFRWNLTHSKYFQVNCEHAQCFQHRCLKAERPGVKPTSTTSESWVQRPNVTITPPDHCALWKEILLNC